MKLYIYIYNIYQGYLDIVQLIWILYWIIDQASLYRLRFIVHNAVNRKYEIKTKCFLTPALYFCVVIL